MYVCGALQGEQISKQNAAGTALTPAQSTSEGPGPQEKGEQRSRSTCGSWEAVTRARPAGRGPQVQGDPSTPFPRPEGPLQGASEMPMGRKTVSLGRS